MIKLNHKAKQPLRGGSHFTIRTLKGDFHFTRFRSIATTKSHSDITFFIRLWNLKCCIPLQWIGHPLTSSMSLSLLFVFLLLLFALSQRNPNQGVDDPRLWIFNWISFLWALCGLCFGILRLKHSVLGAPGTIRLRAVVWVFSLGALALESFA